VDGTPTSNSTHNANPSPIYTPTASTEDPASDPARSDDPEPAHEGSTSLTESNMNAHHTTSQDTMAESDNDRKKRLQKAAKELYFELADREILPQHEGKTPMEFWMASR